MSKQGRPSKDECVLWMLVTEDKYELPIAIFDRLEDLARYVGSTPNCIRTNYYKAVKKGYHCKYCNVRISND